MVMSIFSSAAAGPGAALSALLVAQPILRARSAEQVHNALVRKTPFLAPFYTCKTRTFYQDRLGTSIVNVERKGVFYSKTLLPWSRLPGYMIGAAIVFCLPMFMALLAVIYQLVGKKTVF